MFLETENMIVVVVEIDGWLRGMATDGSGGNFGIGLSSLELSSVSIYTVEIACCTSKELDIAVLGFRETYEVGWNLDPGMSSGHDLLRESNDPLALGDLLLG